MIKAYKLVTGPDGHSYVSTGTFQEDQFHPTGTIRFKESPPHSEYDWHPAPRYQYVICLTGTLEFTLYSGETFLLRPGEVLIAMDTTGSGHKWRIVDDQPWKRIYVTFEDEQALNFIPD